MLEGKKLVVIMGAPRSGTTWLQAMVNACPEVVTMSEMWVLSYTAQWMRRWETQQNRPHGIGLPLVWSREEMLAELRTVAEKTYSKLLDHQPDAKIILDKTPEYVQIVEHIHDLFPDVQFIHIIRDGRDVTASTLAASRNWGAAWADSNARTVASKWVKKVTAGRQAQQYDNHYLEVRYEDLLERDTTTLQAVFEAVGIEKSTEEIQAIYEAHTLEKMRESAPSGSVQSQESDVGIIKAPKEFYRKGQTQAWKTDLTSRQKYAVYQAAQELLTQLGYASDSTWWYSSSLQRTMLTAENHLPKTVKKILLKPFYTSSDE